MFYKYAIKDNEQHMIVEIQNYLEASNTEIHQNQ